MQSRITDKGQRYGVCVLRKRRADLAGEIGALVLQLKRRRADMAKVDDLLRLLAPTSDPTRIVLTKQIRYLNIFKQGELGRLLIFVGVGLLLAGISTSPTNTARRWIV